MPRAWGRDGSPSGFRGHFKGYPCTHAVYGLGHGYGVNYEDLYYEQALTDTFRLAHDRLRAEAAALGAHGVVGVRHTLSDLQVASSAPVVELKMVGTAICRPSAPPLKRAVHLPPVRAALREAPRHRVGARRPGLRGWRGQVVRAVASACRVRPRGQVPSSSQRSEAVQQAQRIAVDALEDQAEAFGEQVVGVDVALSIRERREAAMVSMRAIGTAVRRFRTHEAPVPTVILRLSDTR